MRFWLLIRLLTSIDRRLSSVEESIEMADLSALKAVVADLKDNVVARVVAALQSQGVPQADIDAITQDVQSSVNSLNIALPAPPPTP